MNDLLAALAAAGIDDSPVFDGNIHRCKVAGKKGKPGWYVFHDLNGKIFGCFGDWSTGEKSEWRNGNGLASLTDREMEALRLAAEARRRERRRMAEQAAKEAAELLRDAEETEGHPYCLSKGIKGPVPVADGEIIVCRSMTAKISSQERKRLMPQAASCLSLARKRKAVSALCRAMNQRSMSAKAGQPARRSMRPPSARCLSPLMLATCCRLRNRRSDCMPKLK